ncbi:prepilin-type N-terminal cleavage/methylation domain-containing protein [Methylobacterium sp. CB376]|uniref:prepilin-type N-terminal cleavage/methylation domain-containing protein n=1 Tax=Methylobacterium sp. CB376 TaxID=3138063 RepID=UPI0024B1ABC9|nr:prepilin-type N-terminal cleavage/methylation domain-containing protein [Methylobacterium nodulans]WFT82194.1 prepilin-type N-terminal cleavage/methylation domain-containing protein [Methylobacterium nodulans]
MPRSAASDARPGPARRPRGAGIRAAAGRISGEAGRAGFTLVEALAAFAIVAMLSLALQRGLVQSRLGWLWIDDRVAAARVARSLLVQPVNLAQAAAGGWEEADGRRFRVRLSPVALPLPPPPPEPVPPVPRPPDREPAIRWVPLRERIEVETARGALALETIRLCPFEEERRAAPAGAAPRG